ncbi:MAG: DUF421 domain-containing protein [Marmoricola sp.]
MWNDLVSMGVSAPDKILRTVLVYAALAVLLRLAGKRDLAQLNAFDLVVIMLLSNVVQNAVIGPDNSLVGGLLGAVVLVAFNGGIVRLVRRSDTLATLLEGRPTVLASDGHWDTGALREEGLRRADVEAAVRRQGAASVTDTDRVTLEPGGTVVASLAPQRQPATLEDLARLEAKLDRLLAASGSD